MRQQGNNKFIDLLDSVRVENLSTEHRTLLNSWSVEIDQVPENAIYIFAENALKDYVSQDKLSQVDFQEVVFVIYW